MWLTIVGAIASAIISYYTAYNDLDIKDILHDIAYDLKQVLAKLNEIAGQIDALAKAVAALPEQIRREIHEEAINTLNTAISRAIIAYQDLVRKHEGPVDKDFSKIALDIFYRVQTARTELEALSRGDNEIYSAITAVMSPVAMMLEMGGLFRLGKDVQNLRDNTAIDYGEWFNRILDPSNNNSLAHYVIDLATQLATSDGDLKASPLDQQSRVPAPVRRSLD